MIAAKRITSLLCAGVLAATTLGVTVQAAPDRRAHVGRNSRLNPAPTPVRGRDVPGLIADPDNLRHLVEIDDDFRNGTCSFHVTFNGGKTWKGGNVKAPEGFTKPVCSGLDSLGRPHINGTAAFGSKNNVYMAFSSIREGDALDSVLVAKSTDGGRSFETAVVAIPSTADPALGYVLPGIAVSPRKGGQDLVHVVANSVIPPAQPGRRSRLKDLVSVTSTNGGESFSAPVIANAPADKTRSEHSQPYVGPDGTIYFVYRVAIDPGFTGRAMLRLGVSKDAGQTWTQENVATVVGLTYPRMTVDPRDGTLYAAFEELREDRKFDAFIRSSTDGGKTWSERVRVNDDPENNDVQNQMPWVSTGPNGRVDVVWYDRRNTYPGAISSGHFGANVILEDVYYAYSTNKGKTFSENRRITDRTMNRDVGVKNEIGAFYPPAAAPLDRNELLVAWGDSREGNVDTDTQDIYQAKVTLDRTGQVPVQRLRRQGAVARSVELSRLAYPGGGEERQGAPHGGRVSRVVIVNRSDHAEALAAGVLARANVGPVLLSRASGLSPSVRKEVARIAPVGAYIVGNESSLSEGVKSDLVDQDIAEGEIERIAGATPDQTARLIAEEMDTRSAQDQDKAAFAGVVVVNPASKTASTASALAAGLRLPILFANRRVVSPGTSQALGDLKIDKTMVVGHPKAVSDKVVRQLPNPTILGGPNTYGVSRAILHESLRRGLPRNVVYVVSDGRPLEGALLGHAVARMGGLLLVTPNGSTAPAHYAVRAHGIRDDVDRFVLLRS